MFSATLWGLMLSIGMLQRVGMRIVRSLRPSKIDADGVKGLSMRRLGDALGVEAMAMYHHFPNKEAILDGIVTQLMADAHPQLGPSARDWKEAMVLGLAVRRGAIEAHPKVGPLFLGRQVVSPTSLAQFEAPLSLLYQAGFRGQELADAAHAIFAYAAGWFILASGEGGSWSGPTAEDVATAPEAAPVAASLATEIRDWSGGFDEGLMALLDGLEARRGRRGGRHRSAAGKQGRRGVQNRQEGDVGGLRDGVDVGSGQDQVTAGERGVEIVEGSAGAGGSDDR